MESDVTISKDGALSYFAQLQMPNAYRQGMTPSRLLGLLAKATDGQFERVDPSMRTTLQAYMPETIVGLATSSKGEVNLSSYKTANLLGEGNQGISIPGSGIAQILIGDSIMEGAMSFTSFRESLDKTMMTSDTKTVPFFTKRAKIPECAQKADAYDIAQDLGHSTLRAKTFKACASVAGELLSDSQGIDLFPSVLKELGGDMELTLDAYCMTKMLASASASPVTAPATGGALQAIATAQGVIGKGGYKPNKVIMSPMFSVELMKQFIPAYNAPAQEGMYSESLLARWMGLEIRRSGSTPNDSTPWDWSKANDVGAIVFDSSKAGLLGIREDMLMTEYEDVIKWVSTKGLISRYDFASTIDENLPKRNNRNASILIKRTA